MVVAWSTLCTYFSPFKKFAIMLLSVVRLRTWCSSQNGGTACAVPSRSFARCATRKMLSSQSYLLKRPRRVLAST
uniref:Putative secreted protein n=1 Tax=Ixodes ricinus TaxID=34613 RepID=A0A6B0UB14_IXORI